jgi:hypothetical protein
VHFNIRLADDRLCTLVMIGGTGGSALDRRTARHVGYAVSQRVRKRRHL